MCPHTPPLGSTWRLVDVRIKSLGLYFENIRVQGMLYFHFCCDKYPDHKQLPEEKGSFALQFRVTAHHVRDTKAESRGR